MIEVEIKCMPTPEQKEALLLNATFLSEEHMTDVYYDSSCYELTTKDFWLRTRNGKFMLKKPAATCSFLDVQCNTPKHEIEDEQEICAQLNILNNTTLEQSVIEAGYKSLYTFTNCRKKYSKEGFIIDFDCANLGDCTYELCELETVVKNSEEIEVATQKLIAFAQRYGIEITPIEGKLIVLIKKINPDHFQALQEARAKRLKQTLLLNRLCAK